jgi:hypothetical protein
MSDAVRGLFIEGRGVGGLGVFPYHYQSICNRYSLPVTMIVPIPRTIDQELSHDVY